MKNSIKRAQSRAGSSFAERENFRPKVKHIKKHLMMTLALLLMAATGAWADETPKVVFEEHFESEPTDPTAVGFYEFINTEEGDNHSVDNGELAIFNSDGTLDIDNWKRRAIKFRNFPLGEGKTYRLEFKLKGSTRFEDGIHEGDARPFCKASAQLLQGEEGHDISLLDSDGNEQRGEFKEFDESDYKSYSMTFVFASEQQQKDTYALNNQGELAEKYYLSLSIFNPGYFYLKDVVLYEIPSTATPVPLTRGTGDKINEWTLTNGMPAGNVTVNVTYFPKAEFAMSNDGAPLKPKAKYDAQVNSNMPLVKAGVVANIVEGEQTLDKKQGTLVYHVSETELSTEALGALLDVKDDEEDPWSEVIPTADGLPEGPVYVYYYIRGAENVEGSTVGVPHTFSDSDIQKLTVNVQPEPVYDVELNDATAEAANWKAKVGTGEPSDNDVFPLTGVTKGQKVTVKYKGDRKVIGVKAEKLDLTTKVWKPGDKFHIGQAWFYPEDNNQNKCFHTNGVESQVTEFKYDDHYEQWYLNSFVIVDKQIENDTESQLLPATRPLWLSVPAGKSSTPVGFKIISGDGSKNSPYMFGLVY